VAVYMKVVGLVPVAVVVEVKCSDTADDVHGEPDEHQTNQEFERLARWLRNRVAEDEDGATDQEQRYAVSNPSHGEERKRCLACMY